MAIKLTVKRLSEVKEFKESHFLGSPYLPMEWIDSFNDNTFFFLQLKLSDLKDLDKDNLLPHKGYLYIFLDASDNEYQLKPIVKYYEGEPEVVVNGFNEIVDGFEEYNQDYVISFEECDDYEDGNKLFGKINDIDYEDDPRKLLLQFDPLDSEMGIFSHMDGYLYFFFGEDIEDVELVYGIS